MKNHLDKQRTSFAKMPDTKKMNKNKAYFSFFCGEYVQDDSLVQLISQNKTLIVRYNDRYQISHEKIFSAYEKFYPSEALGSFFSKASDEKLKFSLVNGRLTLKIGDTVFERFERFLKSDLKLSIYQDYLSGATLWLRPIFPADYMYVTDCFMNPASMRYWATGVTYTLKQTQDYILKCANFNIAFSQTSVWSVITHDGLAGCFWATKNETNTETDIGYVARPHFSGRGLTTEAGKLILDKKFSSGNFNGKIIATFHPNNKASQRVLEKLGLEPDPERQNVSKFGSVRNYYQRIVKEEPPIILHDFYKSRALLDLKSIFESDQSLEIKISKIKQAVQNVYVIIDKMMYELGRVKKELNLKNPKWMIRKIEITLEKMVEIDQVLRGLFGNTGHEEELLWEIRAEIDLKNRMNLKDLLTLSKSGWFNISEFGLNTDNNAWLIVQHADNDLHFQSQILLILTELVKSGETTLHNYALLYDRVAKNSDKPQCYGTQMILVNGNWEPFPIEDREKVNERRLSMGLQTLEAYQAEIEMQCPKPPILEEQKRAYAKISF